MTRSARTASVGAASRDERVHHRVAHVVARATFIDERPDAGTYENTPDQKGNTDTTLLSRLKDAVAGGDEDGFRRWLNWSGLDISGAVRALEPVRLRNPEILPPWGSTVRDIVHAVSAVEDAGEPGPVPFDDLLRPIVALAGRKLDDRLRAASHGDGVDPLSPYLGPAARLTIDRSLLDRLSYVAAPTLAGELAARRPLGTAMLLSLVGADERSLEGPQRRELYCQFVREAMRDGLLSLFEGYPVLARLLAVTVDDWLDSTMELLDRLRDDLDDLHHMFGPLRPAERPAPEFGGGALVTGLHPELSDRHHGGRSTVAVTFASGLRLVYKPRDVSLEAAYSRLLDWCNSQDLPLRFSVLRVLDRGTHGWVEHVTSRECRSSAEVTRYYRRAGMQLALLYATGASDCHAENVIAIGDQLALVDCETLLYGEPSPIDATSDTTSFDSVLRVGLLPSWECRFDTQFTVDVSGLGFLESQPLPARRWSRVNTDLMQVITGAAPTGRLDNLPRYGGAVQRPVDHITELVDGFRTMYRLLLRNRDSLAAPDGPFAALADGRMRLVFRPTAVYGALLDELVRPDCLRSGTDASFALWKLSRPFVEAVSCPPAWPVLAAELRALKRLDIPFFAAGATETSLTTGLREPLEGYFPRPPFEETRSRLDRLSLADLKSQVEIIRGAVYCGVAAVHTGTPPVASAGHRGGALLSSVHLNTGPDAFVSAAGHLAQDIADRIIRRPGGPMSWLGLNYAPRTGRMQVEFVGESVFDGTAGIAMFLAAYGRIAGDPRFVELALTVLEPVRRTLEDPTSATSLARRLGLGGATGIGSLAYALSVVARLLDDHSLLSDARGCIALVRELVDGAGVRGERIEIDVVNGSAGACLSMLAVHRLTHAHEALELAMTLGERVCDRHESASNGDPSTANPGFAHGSAGVSYALARLHQVSGGVRPYDLSVDLLHRLAAADSAAIAGIEPGLRGSWCNGVPGIALALLGAQRTMQQPMVTDLIVAMVRDTATWPPRGVDHLCCGAFGRVEVLLTASEVLGHPHFRTEAISGAAALVDRARRGGGYQLQGGGFGAPYFDPSFFHGAAGIGYGLLRLAAAESLPSVLLWD